MTAISEEEGCKRLWYTFRDAHGEVVEGGSDVASPFVRERLGDIVPVRYDPELSAWNEIDRWVPKYGGPAAILLILAPWLIGGLLMLLTGRNRWSG